MGKMKSAKSSKVASRLLTKKSKNEDHKFSAVITNILLLLSFLHNMYLMSNKVSLFGQDHVNFGAGRSVFVGTLVS